MATRRKRARQVVRARPAETGGITSSLGVALAVLLGVDDVETIAALTVIVGFIPAAITWTVNLWRGDEV